MTLENRFEEEVISAFARKYPIAGRTIHALISDYGGVQSLISELESRGFDEAMNSWLKPAKKTKPIPIDQVKKLFSAGRIETLATSLGMTPDAVETQVAQYLPKLFSQLGANNDDMLDFTPGQSHASYKRAGPPPV